MNEYVCVGKIVNTHGIKGELRILSDFEDKHVFDAGKILYLGNTKIPEAIETYRVHKVFDMVTFKGYSSINEVLGFKNEMVYVKRDSLNVKDYLYSDLLGMEVIQDEKVVGVVKEYYLSGSPLLEVEGVHHFYIPLKGNYIEKVDLDKKQVIVNHVEELFL